MLPTAQAPCTRQHSVTLHTCLQVAGGSAHTYTGCTASTLSLLRFAGAEGQLSIADLVRGLGDQRARLGPARKTLERLARKAEPVAPPLPGPVQRRQERRAGYEHAKEDVAKWQGIVKVMEGPQCLRSRLVA